MMIDQVNSNIKIEKKGDHLAIVFPTFSELRAALKKLKKKHNFRGTWKNLVLFYLPLFDDYYKEYFIDDVLFQIETDGHTWMEGLALVTKKANDTVFDEIIKTLNH